ncbi:hypothetical protein F0562_020123 [Nyssa sinensis]|uniref:Uncharacterized protein n=1 Tax=Nyssa sinensis TaxID=561372 RepID=A0A5J5BR13_9ASTE|nr:hypothetical protein F0562_020123 [Nyssa sinensis]
MGGKGNRRREKNYRAAHGGHSRLPPPPVSSSLDAVPSKLRQIMAFANSSQPGSERRDRGGGGSIGVDKKCHSKDELDAKATAIKGKVNDGQLTQQHMDRGDEIVEDNTQKVSGSKEKETQKNKCRRDSGLSWAVKRSNLEKSSKLRQSWLQFLRHSRLLRMLHKRGFVCRLLRPTGIGKDGHQGQGFTSLHP